MAEEFKKGHSLTVTKDLYIKATNIVIEASSNITLKVGQSSIAIDNSGVKVKNASGTVALDAMKIEAKGSVSAKVEGGMAELSAKGITTVKGSMVKIN